MLLEKETKRFQRLQKHNTSVFNSIMQTNHSKNGVFSSVDFFMSIWCLGLDWLSSLVLLPSISSCPSDALVLIDCLQCDWRQSSIKTKASDGHEEIDGRKTTIRKVERWMRRTMQVRQREEQCKLEKRRTINWNYIVIGICVDWIGLDWMSSLLCF